MSDSEFVVLMLWVVIAYQYGGLLILESFLGLARMRKTTMSLSLPRPLVS